MIGATGPLAVAVPLALAMLVAALVLVVIRLARGPSTPDRVVALDLASSLSVGVIVVQTVATGEGELMRAATVVALLSFLGTVAVASYITGKGAAMIAWIVAVLLVSGAAFMLIAAVGLTRFPDLITRMHAAAKAGGVGVGLMATAVAVHAAEAEVVTEAVLVAVFLLLTAPVAAHMIARAAYLSGVPLWSGTTIDELRPRLGRAARSEPDGAGGGVEERAS
jgi:multicomponent Na+:H+ antiporter subunit G